MEMENTTKYPGILINPAKPDDGFFLAAGEKSRLLLQKIFSITDLDCPLLIIGESGTGKELVAKAVHFHGKRRHQPFIPVNCAALNNDLMGSQLFGHKRGAFTGAHHENPGLIRAAEGGTLFLDEISSLSLEAQAQLLRFLETGEVRAVGGTSLHYPDVRIVTAANISLEKLAREQKFRSDLFYRLNVYPLKTIPLREDCDGIRRFAAMYLESFSQRYGFSGKYFSRRVRNFFHTYAWPGNVREMKALVLRALINSGQSRRITFEHLELDYETPESCQVTLAGDWQSVIDTVEYHYFAYHLQKNHGNQQQVVQAARKSKNYVRRRLKDLGINPKP